MNVFVDIRWQIKIDNMFNIPNEKDVYIYKSILATPITTNRFFLAYQLKCTLTKYRDLEQLHLLLQE
jgi:hypothetical protein